MAEHIALELQRESGAHVYRGKTRSAGEPGRYNVIYGYWEERVGLAAGELAVRLVNQLVEPAEDFDFLVELERLILLAERRAFGPSTQAIVDEAASRDIPWIRLNEASLVQLGWGRYQQRIRATMTSKTTALAVDIAGDKDVTRRLLASAGLPVPRGEIVQTEDDAVAAAAKIGFPVVTKPLDGNHGRGVGLDLRNEHDVRTGFDRARPESRRGHVVVESFVTGNDYRVLVVGGRMVAVAERVPAHVIGDGMHTVNELVEIANSDPRRGIGHEKVLTRIKVDDAAIELVRKQGFGLDDVPPKDAFVKLAATGQHVDGRHLDRPHLGGARGERRDRRGGGARGRARRRRHRLPRARHLPAGARDRRRDRRGERGAGVPDAHPPDRRARRSSSRSTSSTCCSRAAPPRASRSSRSRARTARPRRPG